MQMMARAATDLAPAAMIAGAIPLIDVAGHLAGDAESSRKAAAQLRWAFENVGFYYMSGHGVPQSLIDRTYEAAARFHAQPMAKKLALKVNEHNIGYLPISDAASPQAAAQGRKPSRNEAYFLRRERAPDDPAVIVNRRFYGLNQWPDDLPGFRATALEYMRRLKSPPPSAGADLCRSQALPDNAGLKYFFDACFAVPHMILRMSRYPVIDGEDETVASLVPHTDSGFMTLLPPQRPPANALPCMAAKPCSSSTSQAGLAACGRRRKSRARRGGGAARRVWRGALCNPVLLRPRSRHDDRMPAELLLGG